MHPQPDDIEEVRQLLYKHVPAVAEGLVEIKGIARIRGQRTLVFVWSTLPKIDPMGDCIGARGIHVKTIVKTLSPEKIDVVRWSESVKVRLDNAFAPHVRRIVLDETEHRATVYIRSGQLAEAETRRALLSQLLDWEIQIETNDT